VIAKLEEVAARERPHLADLRARGIGRPVNCIVERDGAHDVRLAVGDVERVPVARQTRRLREGRFVARAVHARLAPRAREDGDRLPLRLVLPDLMRAGHGDVERAPDEL
jgi:hypothetical protein